VNAKNDSLILRVLGTLNEAQARWFVAKEALVRGRGGLQAMSTLTGMSRTTILKGMDELQSPRKFRPTERIRRPGGGRKRVEVGDPEWVEALRTIMEETTAGDPMSLLRWTTKSVERIAEELTRRGHPVSGQTVRRRLVEMEYSLQANVKNKEGPSPRERDEQFRHITDEVKRFLERHEPVLSVDTKKKEKVGEFKNGGRAWRPKGQPTPVNTYDFANLAKGVAIPYGAYDMQRNEGLVNVGMSHDTAEFAVETIRQWWRLFGCRHYPRATSLLICADGGGSNGSRVRAWKYHLQALATNLRVPITVCHYPPGASKWNRIEHRMFSYISLNWKGQPLASYEAILNLIGSTRTKTGLKVKALLDQRTYETGIKIPDEDMKRLSISYHRTNPRWNYTISPIK
jgi:DDE family transposase